MPVLSITAPIFILIALGFFAARMGLMQREQIRGIGVFVISFALPALVIRAMATRPIGEVLDWRFLLAYGLGSLLVYVGGLTYSRRVRQLPLRKAAILSLGMSCSNSGFIGYPLAFAALGAPAGVGMALCMLVENLVMIPLALMLAEYSPEGGTPTRKILLETLRRLSRNPVVIGIVVGLSVSILEIPLHPILLRSIDLLANASAPAALFVIGGLLYGLKPRGMLADVAQVTTGKLLLHPLVVGTLVFLMPGVDPTLRVAAVLFSSIPVMSVFPILGQRYGLEETCAASLFVATCTAFFTTSLLLLYVSSHMPA